MDTWRRWLEKRASWVSPKNGSRRSVPHISSASHNVCTTFFTPTMTDAHKQDSLQRQSTIKRVTRTGGWDRAIVYDPESGKVDIRKKRDIEKDGIQGWLHSLHFM